jgi:predicted transcriptional regulator
MASGTGSSPLWPWEPSTPHQLILQQPLCIRGPKSDRMASEEHIDVSIRLPPDLGEWLDEQAAEMNRSREDIVREIVAAYQSMTESDASEDVLTLADLEEYVHGDDLEDYVQTDDLEDYVQTDDLEDYVQTDDLEDYVQTDDLTDELDEQNETFTDLLDDVRRRVVQVKREADAKAHAEHEHVALEERLEAMEDDVTSLSEAVGRVEEDLDAGFENFEDVLEYLTETTDELERKTGTLARVLVDVRTEVKRLSAQEARRAETEAIQLAANREGVEQATCEECGSPVDVSLLSAPECPHCASTFNDVEKRSGLFSSNRLVTGDPPALPEGHDDDMEADLAADLADHAEDAPE